MFLQVAHLSPVIALGVAVEIYNMLAAINLRCCCYELLQPCSFDLEAHGNFHFGSSGQQTLQIFCGVDLDGKPIRRQSRANNGCDQHVGAG